jgi:release factor glutamine methyltransferase
LLDQDEIVARLRAAGCVFAEEEADLIIATADSSTEMEAMLERRVGGDPLEHVLGWVEFCGQVLAVDPGVFVPRRRTELLVTQAVARCPRDAVVVDLCCGNGAVGAAIAAARPGVELHAADIDPAAVACARRNLDGIGTVHLGDFDAPLPADLAGRVDVLVANVPYVPTWAIPRMPTEARDHEPHIALDGGPDGLDMLRKLLAVAPRWLVPGGHVLAEADERQFDAARDAVHAARLAVDHWLDDELGTLVVIGRYLPGMK